MDDVLTAEDHPQFRFKRLMDGLGFAPQDVQKWTDCQPPAAGRNQLISLSLRPAPITDQWLSEGPTLPDLISATQDITLIEAMTPRAEALAIALILRHAAAQGQKAALISPDRNLTRQVTAALDRWALIPDDSAGRPLALSAPGRYLRQIAGLFTERLTPDRLLALLKHPLTASGGDRGLHLKLTRDLELNLRRFGPAFPTAQDVMTWAKGQKPQAQSNGPRQFRRFFPPCRGMAARLWPIMWRGIGIWPKRLPAQTAAACGKRMRGSRPCP
jgi:inactivated superfamily I helicase